MRIDGREISSGEQRVMMGRRRVVWAGRTFWFRTYTVGGYDGYRTLLGERLPCGEVALMWAGRRGRSA